MPHPDDLKQRIQELEEKVRILQMENNQLAERAEDTLLLGLIAEQISRAEEIRQVLESGLERISILKDIPFCACCSLAGDKALIVNAYLSFTDEDMSNPAIVLPEAIMTKLAAGHHLLSRDECRLAGISIELKTGNFVPLSAICIPFRSRFTEANIFFFADNKAEDRLPRLADMLHRVTEMMASRVDNISLFQELQSLNRELDSKIENRTRKLQESENRFRQFFENEPAYCYMISPDGLILNVNKAALNVLGYRKEELVGKPLQTIYAPESLPKMKEDFEEWKATGKLTDVEMVILSKSGDRRTVLLSSDVVKDAEGKTIHSVSVQQDITERKLAEEALRESEQRFRSFFERTNAVMLLIDPATGAIVDANPSSARFYGYSRQELCAMTIQDINILSPQEIATARQQALALRCNYFIFPHRLADGRERTVEVHSTPVEVGGRPLLFSIINDITERKKAEQDLKKNEEFLNNIVENIPNSLFVKDAETLKYVRFNKAGEQLTGYSREELLGKNSHDFFPKEIADYFTAKDREVLAKKELVDIPEETIRTKGGVERVLHTRKLPILDDTGKPQYLVGISEDITERKKVEESVRKLTQAVEQSPASIVITDASGTIEFVNAKFTQITGYTYAEAVGQNPRILKSGETTAEEYLRLWKTISSGGVWKGEFHNRKKNGELFWEQATIAPLKNANHIITHYVAVKEDITERKKIEEQLRQAQKMEAIGTLAGGIAHDLNNILTAIMGYGHIALMKTAKDDPKRLSIENMLEAVDRAAHLTKDLLLFSRKQISERKPVDLNDIIRRVDKFLKRVIGEDVDCRAVLSNEALTILGDVHQLDQVLMNLATNARDAMATGGVFMVATERVCFDEEFISVHGCGKPGNYALITISDTGRGMEADTRAHIFEPFFTTKEVGKGTGLGLAVVYGIIKQHEGFINVYSEPGRGTTFKIYLPLIVAQVGETASAEEEHPPGGTETILLAEDDETVRNMTRTVLEQSGYTVITAIDGQDAVNIYGENKDRIHLLLFDLIMPRKTGKEAYDEIRAVTPGVKVLFISGYAPDMVRQKLLLEDKVLVVSKPMKPTELLKKVRETLCA